MPSPSTAGAQDAGSSSVPDGPSGSRLTRSTTNRTGSSLPMPSWALPCSPNASFGGAATATRLPRVLPSIASVSAGGHVGSDREQLGLGVLAEGGVDPLLGEAVAEPETREHLLAVLELRHRRLRPRPPTRARPGRRPVPGDLGLRAELAAHRDGRQALAASVVAGPRVVTAGSEEQCGEHEQSGQATGGTSGHEVIPFLEHENGPEAADRRGHPTWASQLRRCRLTCRR